MGEERAPAGTGRRRSVPSRTRRSRASCRSRTSSHLRLADPAGFSRGARNRQTQSEALSSATTVATIVELRRTLTAAGLDAGADTIAWYLEHHHHHHITVSRATIYRTLRNANTITPAPKPKTSYIRFQAEQPNETWQADFTHHRLANGTDIEFLTWLDDHSRYALSVTTHRPVTGPAVVATTPRRNPHHRARPRPQHRHHPRHHRRNHPHPHHQPRTPRPRHRRPHRRATTTLRTPKTTTARTQMRVRTVRDVSRHHNCGAGGNRIPRNRVARC